MSAEENAGGWPDADKPGVPLNAERDGWHWVFCTERPAEPWPAEWRAAGGCRRGRWPAGWIFGHFEHDPATCRYIGPCLTPSEIAAREAAAAVAMKEAAAFCASEAAVAQKLAEMRVSAEDARVWGDHAEDRRELAENLRALPLPASALAALDAVRREAVMQEREACADMIDCGCPCRDAVLAMLRRDGARKAQHECKAGRGSDCCALQAAAIRARGEEGGR